ncbi:MAG: serine/threonine-protein kinase [Pseudomonadota bacterium]
MTDQQNPNMMATVWNSGPAEKAAALAIGDRFADRYEILREIGAGGMGVVYLVKEHPSEQEVVLKLIHPSLIDDDARQRMIDEGVNARRITNQHVVRVFDIGEHQGQVYLTMEHVEGRPLRAWMADNLANRVDAPLSDVLKIVHEILSGLAAAHAEGVVHRDLKPENIMISGAPGDADFKLKILDFGIARGLKTSAFTGSSPMLGTIAYMAPEQQTTPNAVGPEADIYSVGRMLYEMLMDILPDGTWNPPSQQRSDVPAAMDAVIRKALQPPKHRYQGVAEFAAALDEAVQGTAVEDVSSEVWLTDGGAKLLASLKELDSSIAERMAGGVKWISDNIKPADREQKSNGGGGGAGGQTTGKDGGSAEQNRKPMLIAAGVGALAVFAIIASSLGPGEDPVIPSTQDVIPSTPDTVVDDGGGTDDRSIWDTSTEDEVVLDGLDGQQPPPPPPATLSGNWRLDDGTIFIVREQGGMIQGTGQTGGWGQVNFQGPLEGPIQIFSVSFGQPVAIMEGGLQPRSGGIPGFDWVGYYVDFNTGQQYQILFHINH